jgi:hypothetical protein
MPDYTVQQGDTLTGIADQFRLATWRRIYDHPQNAAFRRKRPNPDLLFPGDVLYVPDLEEPEYSRATDAKHKFRFKKPAQMLRVAVEDMEGKRLADRPYTLVIDGEVSKGTTDARAMIEKKIPVDAKKGVLKVGDYRWTLAIGHLNPLDPDTPDGGVSGAQGRLRNLGYPVGPVDGISGAKTQASLRYFQADEHLPETGELDAATRAKLIAVHGI